MPAGLRADSACTGAEGEDTGYSVRQTRDGEFVLVGYTRSSGAGGRDAYLVRVSGP